VSGFPIQRAHTLEPLPQAKRWLIEDMWTHEAVGIIGGEPKSCKSFLALGMAVAVASGRPCLGRFAVPNPGPVLVFAAEDALHIVRQRLHGLCVHEGLELESLDLWAITAPSIRLDHADDRQRLEDTVARIKPSLLILDPFVRLHRIDENVSAAVAPLLAFLRELQRKHHCCVVLVHHARKGGNNVRAGQALRGSSEFHAWGDSNLYIRRRRQALSLTFEHRSAASHEDLALRLQCNDDATALVVSDKTAAEQSIGSPPEPDEHQRVVDALQKFEDPVRLRRLRVACRMRGEALTRTLRELVATGEVLRTDDGWSLPGASVAP
jgi:hypothetical protein